ncbi:MAG: hypothetical protein AAF456_09360 [Planctomycetota bacterium]
MNTAVQLFNWFRWRHWVAFPAMALSVIVAQLLCWCGASALDPAFCTSALTLSMLLVFVCSITVFTFGNDLDLMSGKSSFPAWLYNLPVGSFKLALLPVLAMVLAMSWCWWPAAAGMAFLNDTPVRAELSSPLSLWILPWLGICAFGNTLQAVAWWPFRAGWQRILTLAILFVGGITLLMVNTIQGTSGSFAWTSTITISIVAFSAAVVSVIRGRQFTWRASGLFDARHGNSKSWISRAQRLFLAGQTPEQFGSKWSALLHREWTSVGRYPALFVLLIALPSVTCIVLFLLRYAPTYPQPMVGGFLISIPWLVACGCVSMGALAGTTMAKDRYWKGSYEVPVYLSAMPVSDDTLFQAKVINTLKMSAGVILIGIVTMAIMVWAAWVNPGSTKGMIVPDLQMSGGIILDAEFIAQTKFGASDIEPLFLAGVLCATLCTFSAPWIGLAMGMTGRSWFVVAASTALLGGLVIGMIVLENGIDSTMFYATIRFLLITLLAIKVASAVAAIWMAVRAGVFSSSLVRTMSAIVASGAVMSVGIYVLLETAMFRSDLWTLFAVTMIPCASVIFSRVAIDWNRHR